MDSTQAIAQDLIPINRYRAMIAAGELIDDPEQRFVVEKLSLLARRMASAEPKKQGFARALFGWGREKVSMDTIQGLYIYGSVGRGKSMLMELLVEAVGAHIWRVHFIDFMRNIHDRLDEQRAKEARDPMRGVIDDIAQSYNLLALDEMQVENIADAMIVGRLFEGLFEKGVVLVTTSNRHPKDLYKSGLNRQRFEPFIDEIENHCEIICLDGQKDYRRATISNGHYFAPLNSTSLDDFDKIWKTNSKTVTRLSLDVGGREWTIDHYGDHAARVEFADACETARGAADYIALSQKARTVFIDNMPLLTVEMTSAARRFVTMIDVFYEAKTKLYIRSEAPLDQIHSDPNTSFIWDRTLSRLSEMANEKWGA